MKKIDLPWIRKLAKYKYPVLVILIGLILVLWPSGKKEMPEQQQPEQPVDAFVDEDREYLLQTEQKLEKILSAVNGAGKVRVMLVLHAGKTTQFQSDLETSSQQEGERTAVSTAQKTVIVSKGSAYNEAAIVKTEYPSFQGALIVCDGGENPGVRLALSNAVCALLGLGADKVTVVKSK